MYITVVSPNGMRELLNISTLIGNTLLEVLIKHDYRSAHSCTGNGKCRTCPIQVIAGIEKLKFSDKNEKFMLELFGLDCMNQHLACRIRVHPVRNGPIIRLVNKRIYQL